MPVSTTADAVQPSAPIGSPWRQDILERAILKAITEALLPTVLERAVEKALAKLTYARAHHATRQSQADGNSTRSSESSIYSSTLSQMAYCPPTRSKPG